MKVSIKKTCIAITILVFIVSFSACSSQSKHDSGAESVLKSTIGEILSEYGINNYSLTLQTDKAKYHNSDTGTYYDIPLQIECKEFCNLKADEAINVLYNLSNADLTLNEEEYGGEINGKEFTGLVNFKETITNGKDKFNYSTNISGTREIEYSKDDGTKVTVAAMTDDGQLFYDKFSNSAYKGATQEEYETAFNKQYPVEAATDTEEEDVTIEETESADSGNNRDESGMKEVTDNDLKTHIWVCSQDVARQSLKSPRKAKFCSINEAKIYSLGNKQYMAMGYVDAQNSYGAEMRTDFCVWLTKTKNGYKDGYVEFDE